jgi:cytochrome c oxidase assembly protein subunit 11
MSAPLQIGSPRRNRRIVLLCLGVIATMLGSAYAAVPLYRLFCEVTGYGGVTQRAAEAPANPIGRMMTVEFDANVGTGLPWSFRPVQRRMTVRVGEETLAHYRAVNHSAKPVTGSAVFNVTPGHAGRYFSKIDCFCFVEQTLQPGESVDMPVVFFIDPSISADEDLAQLKTITLSYTFYPLARNEMSGGASKVSAGSVN